MRKHCTNCGSLLQLEQKVKYDSETGQKIVTILPYMECHNCYSLAKFADHPFTCPVHGSSMYEVKVDDSYGITYFEVCAAPVKWGRIFTKRCGRGCSIPNCDYEAIHE